MRAGLEICARMGFDAVAVPEDVFMLLELAPGYLMGAPVTIRYHTVFRGV